MKVRITILKEATPNRSNKKSTLIIWARRKGSSKGEAFIEVQKSLNFDSDIETTASMSVSTSPQLMKEGALAQHDFELVRAWILSNKTALLEYWNEETSTLSMLQQVKADSTPRKLKIV